MLEAAVDVVQGEGADGLGISSVARALGIRPASMYNHVTSGEALARRVADEGTRRLVEALKSAVRGVVEPQEQLRLLAHGVRDWAVANGGLYGLMARVQPDYSSADIPPVARDLLDLFDRPLGQLGIAQDQRVHAMRSLRAAIHGFVLLEASGQFQLDADVAESFRWSVESLIRGVATAT